MLAEKTVAAITIEAEYGTYLDTNQVVIPVESITAKLDPTLTERADMIGSIDSMTDLPTRKVITLDMTSKVYPDSVLGYILQCLLGGATTSGAGDDKTHVFTVTEAGLVEHSIALELKESDQAADDYAGCKLTNWTIQGSNDGYVTMSITMMGQSRAGGTVMTPIVYTSLKPLKYCNVVVSFDSSEVKCDSWSISVNPNLKADNFKTGNSDCETEQPVLNGKPQVTASFEFDTADRANRVLYEAGTAGKQFLVTITSAETIAATETPYSLTLELPDTQIMNVDYSGETGQKKESIELKAYVGTSVASNETHLEATLVNAATSYT